jgi:MFS family permease
VIVSAAPIRRTLEQLTSFSPAVRVLLVGQLAINTGYYLLYPYLAGHMQRDLGMSTALLGLVLGAGTLSQQGLFLIGGTLSDRIGPRRVIICGLLIRTVGFLTFAFTANLPGLLLAAFLSGFAGALFNPAVRAYLAQAAGARRVEAFALFGIFGDAGLLLGPVVGTALVGLDFQIAGVTAAAMFACLALIQARLLPAAQPRGDSTASRPVLRDWREAIQNRPFALFSLAMLGYFALYMQFYLGLPLVARQTTGDESGVGSIFVLSAIVGIVAQIQVTALSRRFWTPARAVTIGLLVMGSAFVLLGVCTALPTSDVPIVQLAPVLAATVILTLGTLIAQPFALDLTVRLGNNERLVGTYFGLYYLSLGIGGAAGNVVIGGSFDVAQTSGLQVLPWVLLVVIAVASATAVTALDRRGLVPGERTPKVGQAAMVRSRV